MDARIKLSGDKELERNLKKITRAAKGRALRKAAKAGAEPIVQSAKRQVSVDTGKMRQHIRSWFSQRRSESVTVSVGVTAKSRAHVARFHELGTSKMAARPFLRPAIDEQKQKAAEETQSTMAEAVLEEVRKSGHTTSFSIGR